MSSSFFAFSTSVCWCEVADAVQGYRKIPLDELGAANNGRESSHLEM